MDKLATRADSDCERVKDWHRRVDRALRDAAAVATGLPVLVGLRLACLAAPGRAVGGPAGAGRGGHAFAYSMTTDRGPAR